MLKKELQQILTSENLDTHRAIAKALADELGIDMLDLAAVLIRSEHREPKPAKPVVITTPSLIAVSNNSFPNFKFIRYRLSVGSLHQVTEDTIKKVLVNESGVDINNIGNILIQGSYTLLNLPDNMPQDIFLHLKTVEINHQKLDIKRVKSGNQKKRGKNHNRRSRQRNSNPSPSASGQVNGG